MIKIPPSFKFSREEIITAAVAITRESGIKALTARSLAEKLGCSVQPIFRLFKNMDEVAGEVIAAANKLYNGYLKRSAEEEKYPKYKATGMGYIDFAKEEKQLFKLLFMRDRRGETINDGYEELKPIISIISENLGISEEKAYLLHLEMWIYVHGIATMIATDYLNWDTEFISNTLTDVYNGLKHRFSEEE